jgi:hypothetical protein
MENNIVTISLIKKGDKVFKLGSSPKDDKVVDVSIEELKKTRISS